MTERCYIETCYAPNLAAFKRHIRMTSADMDAELLAHLKAAINSAEHQIGRVVARSRFVYTGSFRRSLRLKGPNTEVLSVLVDGSPLPETDYTAQGSALTLAETVQEGAELVVNYVAGFVQVPDDIQAAILLHATALFNNPEDSVEALPKASSNLLRPYRSWGLCDE